MTSTRMQDYVSVRHCGRLYWSASGSGDPLVLIHGGNMDHRIWRQQIEVFSPHFRVIAFIETKLNPPAICRLAEIKAQTLVMIGSRDIPDIKKIVCQMESTIRNSIRVNFECIGHMINLEAPERFNQEVLAFLKTVV
jgi:pimeloyl-ACP methyl ester carboxylesterase